MTDGYNTDLPSVVTSAAPTSATIPDPTGVHFDDLDDYTHADDAGHLYVYLFADETGEDDVRVRELAQAVKDLERDYIYGTAIVLTDDYRDNVPEGDEWTGVAWSGALRFEDPIPGGGE